MIGEYRSAAYIKVREQRTAAERPKYAKYKRRQANSTI